MFGISVYKCLKIMLHFMMILMMLIGTEICADDNLGDGDSMKMLENKYKLKWNYDPSDMLNFDKYKVHSGSNDEEESVLNNWQGECGKCFPLNLGKSDLDFDKAIDYTARYINSFLYLLDQQNDEAIKGSNKIIVNFEFVITPEDLSTLENLSKNISKNNFFDGLYEIDEILFKGLTVKPDSAINYFTFLSSLFPQTLGLNKPEISYIFCIIIAVPCLFLYLKQISISSHIVMLLNLFVLVESYWKYQNKKQKADIRDYVDRLQYSHMEDPCKQQKSYFSLFYRWVFGDQCYKYHEALQTSRSDDVSLLQSIFDTYGFYLLEMPSKILGSSIKTFSVNLNDYLPPFISQLATFFTIFIVIGCIVLLIICKMRPRIRLSFLGGRMDFGFASKNRNLEALSETEEKPVKQYYILQLPKAKIEASEIRPKISLLEKEEEDSASVSEGVENMEKNETMEDDEYDLDEDVWVDVTDEEINEIHLLEKPNTSQNINP